MAGVSYHLAAQNHRMSSCVGCSAVGPATTGEDQSEGQGRSMLVESKAAQIAMLQLCSVISVPLPPTCTAMHSSCTILLSIKCIAKSPRSWPMSYPPNSDGFATRIFQSIFWHCIQSMSLITISQRALYTIISKLIFSILAYRVSIGNLFKRHPVQPRWHASTPTSQTKALTFTPILKRREGSRMSQPTTQLTYSHFST